MMSSQTDRSMLTYDAQAVAASLPYDRLIAAIEDAFRSDAVVPDRTHHPVQVPGGSDATLLLMPAWRPGGVLGVKIATIFPGNTQKNQPSVNASYLMLDANSGRPIAILDGPELTARRTAAASALASKYLSRADASTLLMVGTGKLAPHLIRAHATVRNLKQVLIRSRRAEAAGALGRAFEDESFSVSIVDELETAVKRADIISCATLATEPLVKGSWLQPGCHLDLVGAFRADMSEADGEAVSLADIYVDTRAGALAEAGEIVQAINTGLIQESDIVGDLFDMTCGACEGRRSPESITLFKSVGTALEDLAAAELATRMQPNPARRNAISLTIQD